MRQSNQGSPRRRPAARPAPARGRLGHERHALCPHPDTPGHRPAGEHLHRLSHQIQPHQARSAQDPCPRRRQLRQRRCNQPPANPRRPVMVPDLDPGEIEDSIRLPHRRPGQGHRAPRQERRHLDRPCRDPRQRLPHHQGRPRTTNRPGHLPPPLPRPAPRGRLRLRRASRPGIPTPDEQHPGNLTGFSRRYRGVTIPPCPEGQGRP